MERDPRLRINGTRNRLQTARILLGQNVQMENHEIANNQQLIALLNELKNSAQDKGFLEQVTEFFQSRK